MFNNDLENCISYDVINCIEGDDEGNLWMGQIQVK